MNKPVTREVKFQLQKRIRAQQAAVTYLGHWQSINPPPKKNSSF